MWTIFKIINILWLFASTYFWVTALMTLGPLLVVINALMLICLSFLPFQIKFDALTGKAALCLLAIVLWNIWIDGLLMGATTFLMYLPVFFLLQLPLEYKRDLLHFSVKWYAVILIPGLMLYAVTQFVNLPSFGQFVHPNYPPYLNYLVYIKTTFDFGSVERFNSFFLEPGHQSLLSTFLMIACRYKFRQMPWLWVLLISIVLSFSLAGYLLMVLGYVFLQIKSVGKMLLTGCAVLAFVLAFQNLGGGENAFNELIISRLERDESSGIKGNNRFAGDTDYVYGKSVKTGEVLIGMKEKTNMELIAGAGYKIYIINYGLVGAMFALFFYLSVIPPKPDYRYTAAFLIVLILCFFQRAYPAWYSWLFPYVVGIYIAKGDKDKGLEV